MRFPIWLRSIPALGGAHRIQMTTSSRFLFAPAHAPDSTAYGLLVGAHRANGRKIQHQWVCQTARQPYSVLGLSLPGLAHISAALSGESSLPILRGLVSQHSLFGFYSRGTTAIRASRWLEQIISGANGPEKFAMFRSQVVAAPGGLRRCYQCIESDSENARMALWRVLHQVPFLHHCPIHKVALSDRCSNCGLVADPGRKMRLPVDRCFGCGAPPSAADSSAEPPGYWGLLELSRSAYLGDLPGLRSDVWELLNRIALARIGGGQDARTMLRNEVLRRWRCDDEAQILKRIQFSPIEGLDLRKPGIGLHSPTLFGRLVVIDALISLGALKLAELQDAQVLTPETSNFHDRLSAAALDFGIPSASSIVSGLLAGRRVRELVREHQISPERLRRFLADLDEGMLSELEGIRGPKRLRGATVADGSRIASTTAFEEKRQIYRQRMLVTLQQHRTASRREIAQASKGAYDWLRQHDDVWLEQHLPIRAQEQKQRLTTKYRAEIVHILKANPDLTRTQLQKKFKSCYRWLFDHDRPTLDRHLPSRRTWD